MDGGGSEGARERGREEREERGDGTHDTFFHRLPSATVASPTGQACKNSTLSPREETSWLVRASISSPHCRICAAARPGGSRRKEERQW